MKYALYALLLLTGCGYHLGTGALAERYKTVTVPYVQGDSQGILTKALVEKIASQSMLRYSNNEGDLLLKVCIPSPKSQNIGYRYAPNNSKVVVANEGRLSQEATITLVDCANNCTVLGPTTVLATFDYDFEPDMGTVNQHAFSLGQLEMNSLAKDGATPALYNLLAEKIVDYVNNSW
ncbi:MAG: hypothetical protein S4CHLAM45_12690 [Chlamydiales bacterium]|nr:hypothetical protein [Chlamydiales bacterium]MCH9619758.1 hypothetical protein [Chlamydiales bacterium]MCH9623364.1 hypothetical protein [Chlamydiales bacterium]